jgi:4-amino-4-deoxy-L-arabinose transferase-like glycosyltransferase
VSTAAAPPVKRRRLAALRARAARLPRAIWLCALLAFVNAVAWSLLVPVFQNPDEAVHAGYAQYIGETGKVPQRLSTGPYYLPPPDADIAFSEVPFSILGHPTWSAAQNAQLHGRLDASPRPGSVNEGGAGYASSNPPLYYAYEAIAYNVAKPGDFLDRFEAMRIASALLAALTVFFVFLFLRELLPGTPWAWTVGALAVAFQPLFAFMGGGINNDNLIYLAGSALLAGVARAFRRGMTPGVGVWIGAALAVGVLGKGSMFALIPGAVVGVLLAAWRTPRERRRRALGGVLAAGLTAGIPIVGWLVANQLIYDRAASTTTASFSAGSTFQVRELFSYIWQFYLPRLPFMDDQFPYAQPGYHFYPTFPLWQTYVQGFIGRFGWFQYMFPMWVNWLGLGVLVSILGLAGAALVRFRAAVRRRWPELLTYALLFAGLLLLVNLVGYQYRLGAPHNNFEQARYLLPMIGLYAAVVALATRGAGRRWGPALGALLVTVAIGHNLFAQLLTANRYYNGATYPLVTDQAPKPDTKAKAKARAKKEKKKAP